MKHVFILGILLATSFFSFGQTGAISGKLVDVENQSILFANAVLRIAEDSVFVKGEVSNEEGIFNFSQVPYGKYLLTLRAIGFADTSLVLDLESDVLELPQVVMELVNKELEEVNVAAIRPLFTMHPDKMVVHVEGSPISQGNSAWELLGKLPGVTVMNGNIVLRGKGGVNILVNEKPLMFSGTDLEAYLKSIHASQIKDIEIITNPSAKYDAQGSSGIINIILAKPSGAGFHGSIAIGYGRGTGTNKAYLNLNLSYSGKKGDLVFNLSDNYNEGFNNLDIRKNFFSGDTVTAGVKNDNTLDQVRNSITTKLGYDWYLPKNTTLSVIGTGNFGTTRWDNGSHSQFFNENEALTRLADFSSLQLGSWTRYSVNTHLTHQFDSTGQKLSADIDFARYSSKITSTFETIISDENSVIQDTIFETGNQIGPLSIYAAKLDYSKPFKNGLTLETGIKSSYVKSDKDVAFYYDGDNTQLDSTKSNHFVYAENINAAYINFSKVFGKFSTQLGLRVEHTYIEGNQITYDLKFKRDYIQLFPTLFLNYKANEKHSISLNTGRRINRPHYQQLNPFIRPIDATAWASGNPDLQPEYIYNTELTYNFANKLFVQGSYGYTTQGIISVLALDPTTQITLQKDDNVDTYHEYSLMLMYNTAVKKWWYMNLNFTGFYAQYDGSLLGFYFNRSMPTFYASAQNTFILKGGFKIEQSYVYMHKHLYGTTLIRPFHNFSLGIKKDILKGKGSVSLNASDIFWTNYPRGIVDFNGVEEIWTSERDTRTFYVHFTYNFGKGKNVQLRRKTGADDEKNRAN